MEMAKVLIIDDDEMICEILSRCAEDQGHSASFALTVREGLRRAVSEDYDVVFLDVNLPDGNGLKALPKIRKAPSMPEVIIITGAGTPDGAELAIKSGAWDYIQKPFSKKEVSLQLIRALQYRQEKSGKAPPLVLKRDGIIGSSAQINGCLDVLAQTVSSNASVLITGETGTGKELFARAIHENSPRAAGNFVTVDCAVLPENLVGSVLFGHRKGAFTGADRAHEGLVKQADGGTLFLDEVGELPRSMQKAFLRVLQEHCFRPIGGDREIQSDFRVVAATNRDLDQMARSGGFRQDLLFRLRSFSIVLPPLRERVRDIRDLAMYHVAKLCERNGMETKGFSPEFFEALLSYNWPGNVRELVNTLEISVAAEPSNPILFPKHLPDHIRIKLARASLTLERSLETRTNRNVRPRDALPRLKDLRDASVAQLERQYLKDLMSLTGGDIQEACRVSGLKRTRLYELMKRHHIHRPSGHLI